jgi:small subunit ribosomal protein S14
MKSKIEVDRQRRQLVKKLEFLRKTLKSLSKSKLNTKTERAQAVIALQSLPRNSSSSRVKNRCIITGRSRGIYSLFRLSRLTFRKEALAGHLPGVTKASW